MPQLVVKKSLEEIAVYKQYLRLVEDTNAVDTIVSVSELIRSEANDGDGSYKVSMDNFLSMLKNAGLSIDYDGLKSYHAADPRLQAEIQDFNEKEVVLVGGDNSDEDTLDMEPQGEVPPEKKVNQMAKQAMNKREGVGEGYEEENPVVNAIAGRIMRQRIDLLKDYGLDNVMQAIDEVAEFVGDVEEIGSSDVSGWIKHVEQMLPNMGESVNEGYKILPQMDRERYQERDGLEGPFSTLSGKVVYYDPKEGKYYDPDTDIYMTYDEYKAHDEDRSGMSEDVALNEFTISDLKGMGINPTPDQMKELRKINDRNRGNITRADLKKVGINFEADLDEAGDFTESKCKCNCGKAICESCGKPHKNKKVKEDADAKFEPHMMYDPKTGEGKHAKVEADHLKMKAKGWDHEKPKKAEIDLDESVNESFDYWQSPESIAKLAGLRKPN